MHALNTTTNRHKEIPRTKRISTRWIQHNAMV